MIKLIVCCDIHGGIGKDNDLLFNIPKDMMFFREKTTNKCVLMGSNTFDSLPNPLKDRINIVVGYDENKLKEIENKYDDEYTIYTYNSLEKAIEDYKQMNIILDMDLYIIGGGSIYNQVIDMDIIDEAYITMVYTIEEDAEVFFDIFGLFRQLPKRTIIDKFKHENKKVRILKLTKN